MPNVTYWVHPVSDLDRAERFYGELFGWTFSRGSAGGLHVLNSAPEGGLVEGTPAPRTVLAFSVDDATEAAAKVRALGGTAADDGAGGEHGTWIDCTDDQGTPFALYVPAHTAD